jgi:ribosome-binding factor A
MSSRKSSGRTNRRQHNTARDYPRTARLNELLREILAEELERIDDERLELFTIISVDAESDLRRAIVYYDCLDGEAGDEVTLQALGELRVRLQAAIGRQARTKRTPELSFAPDPSVRSGERIDAILKEVIVPSADDAVGDDAVAGDEAVPGDDADGDGGSGDADDAAT